MTQSRIRSIAIIGSGISGLTVGNLVRETGLDPVLFEKARGPGGRVSSKRLSGDFLDMGAQYFTVRKPEFRSFLDRYAAGAIKPWQGRFLHENEQGEMEPFPGEARWVGASRMSALSRALAQPLTIEAATPVRRAWQRNDQWYLDSDKGQYGPYDALVAATPPAQARALLPTVPEAGKRLREFAMSPCWAVAARFGQDPGLDFEGASLKSPVLDWVARNSSKPGREDYQKHGSWWVLHATPSWSTENLEMAPDEVARQLLAAFRNQFAIEAAPVQWVAHCWRYARPATGNEPPGSVSLDDHRLGFCGDWLAGGRVEGAFSSGLSLVRHWAQLGLIPAAVPEGGRNE
ncbi:hypothetical protein DES49_1482 [Halospina denitrificans]|uniref:Amine oxidase domain-containing protein n=1 Tax=Halospina denitrificans TaxID=332522 RepID=A0A4R7JWK2_9GAMM|nr:FAD-dependent oxidoreductase [Halospina denitrificans]TDT41399.1 hypothetical protein DES49_1482 [Halospina denitrificans]